MFEGAGDVAPDRDEPAIEPAEQPAAESPGAAIDGLGAVLALMGEPALGDAMAGVDDATRVDAIAVLESISGAVAAAQAWAEIELYTSQVQVQQGQGVPTRRRDRGVADQIGLARRISGASAAPELGVAHALVTELPAPSGCWRPAR